MPAPSKLGAESSNSSFPIARILLGERSRCLFFALVMSLFSLTNMRDDPRTLITKIKSSHVSIFLFLLDSFDQPKATPRIRPHLPLLPLSGFFFLFHVFLCYSYCSCFVSLPSPIYLFLACPFFLFGGVHIQNTPVHLNLHECNHQDREYFGPFTNNSEILLD